MVTLLLLTCGTNACYHISKILTEKFCGKFKVVGTDINKKWMIPSAPYLDEFYQCPYTSSKEYYPFILDICREEKIDFILPSFDADQLLFFRGNKDLDSLGVQSLGIPEAIKEIYSSKESTNKYLSSVGLPTPIYYSLSDVKDGCEYFVKPKHGVGSIGARIAKGEELRNSHNDELLIQEICNDPEVTLECFYYKGEIRSIARERLGTKSGVCTKTRVYQDRRLQSIAESFARSIQLPHIFNLQFMINSKGNPVITDVNLRTAGGMSLSYAASWDEVSALANIMLKKGTKEVLEPVSHPISEQFIIRAYTDIVTKKIKHHIAFDLDGTLLDSRKRHAVLMSQILTSEGYNVSTQDLVSFKANRFNNINWLEAKGVTSEKAKEINIRWINEIEAYKYLLYDFLYEGALDVLKELADNNDLYLLTARNNKESLLKQLDDLKIAQYFTDIIIVNSNSETSYSKAEQLEKYDIELFVGDTESDYEASSKSNCQFVASTYGFRSKEFWQAIGVQKVDDIRQIISVINKMMAGKETHQMEVLFGNDVIGGKWLTYSDMRGLLNSGRAA